MKSAEAACKSQSKSCRCGRRGSSAASRRDELAFLPAALEIVETPPSPLGRAICLTIIAVVCAGARLGVHRQGRHRRFGDRKDHPERAHQGGAAVRDRRGARDPCAGRPSRQGRRDADRARSDHEQGRARRISQATSIAGAARCRPAPGGARPGRRSACGISSRRRRRRRAGRHAAPTC